MHSISRKLRLLILAVLGALAGHGTVRAQCVDWTPGYHLAGIDGAVYALAVFDDGTGNGRELYAGGSFQAAGGAVASNIAKWNGARWAAVGVGRPGSVLSLCVWNDGSGEALYAGIELAQGYVPPSGTLATVAKWNGVAWTGLPGGVDFGFGVVRAMTVHDDGSGPALYVGGRFHNNFPVWPQVPGVARFDGTSWSAVGNGIVNSSTGVGALASFDNGMGPALYAGGSHLRVAPGVPNAAIARFNGTNWSLAAIGLSEASAEVRVFARSSAGKLYAAGSSLLSQSSNRVVELNGFTWSPLPGEVVGYADSLLFVPSAQNDLLFASGSLYQVGGVNVRGIAAWDGASWQPLGGDTSAAMGPLSLYDDGTGTRVIAGGIVILPNATDASGIASYAAGVWGALGSGAEISPAPGSSLVTYDDGQGPALYANSSVGVLRRVGAAWAQVGSLTQGTVALAVHDDGVHGPMLHAALVTSNVNGQNLARVARLDGTNWVFLGLGFRFVNTNWSPRIYDLVSFDDGSVKRLLAGGDFDYADGQVVPFVAAWDGQAWTSLGPGLNHLVRDLEVFDSGAGTQVFAGGDFAVAGATPGIARWNGGSWTDAGLGGPPTLAMHVHDFGSGPRLFASRRAGVAGFNAGISVFDGTTWSVLTTGTSPSDFESYDDGSGGGPKLFAAGSFTTIGGISANGIARYDGVQWSALGAGLQGPYGAEMEVHDDGQGAALFVQGSFATAGANAAYRFARYGPTGAVGCVLTTGSSICAGDGSGVACPCGNSGGQDRGCGNSANATGAVLVAEGQAHRSSDSVTLRASGMTPGGAALFFQGTQAVASGAGSPFGDGVRCASGALVRLAIRSVAGGTAAFGAGIAGDPSVSSAGQLPVGASTRIYQAWYRDAQNYCTTSTFNLSNGLRLVWAA